MMHLIFLHGVPGVGKRTIARELAQELGFPFLDFQNLAKLLGPMFGYNASSYGNLRNDTYQQILNEALQLPEDDTETLVAHEKTEELPTAGGDTATVEMPRRAEGQSDEGLDAITSDGDHTVEIITRDDDTVEMEVEGGRVNTKKA